MRTYKSKGRERENMLVFADFNTALKTDFSDRPIKQ